MGNSKKVYNKKWRESNKEWIRSYRKEYYNAHKDDELLKQKQFIKDNPEYVLERNKKYISKHRKANKVWQEANKDLVKDKILVKTYGITLNEYHSMVKKQNGECAICKKHEKLLVDHDHQTGKVRGLLCRKCNLALGGFNDSESLLLSAIQYLR